METHVPPYTALPLNQLMELWRESPGGWAPFDNARVLYEAEFRAGGSIHYFELFAFTPLSGIVPAGRRQRHAAMEAGKIGVAAFAQAMREHGLVSEARQDSSREVARSYRLVTELGEDLLIVLTFEGDLAASPDQVERAFTTLVAEPMHHAFATFTR